MIVWSIKKGHANDPFYYGRKNPYYIQLDYDTSGLNNALGAVTLPIKIVKAESVAVAVEKFTPSIVPSALRLACIVVLVEALPKPVAAAAAECSIITLNSVFEFIAGPLATMLPNCSIVLLLRLMQIPLPL